MPDYWPLRADALLLGLLVAFYLVDAAQLLYSNEVILTRKKRGVWRVTLPTGIEILGRFLTLPNPLRPDVPILRLTWPRGRMDGSSRDELERRVEQALQPIGPIKPLTLLLLFQLFCALPLAYAVSGSNALFLVLAVGSIYANVAALIGILLMTAPSIRLKRSRAALHAFECLVCVPYSLNLYRKLALHCTRSLFPLIEAGALLPESDRREFYSALMVLAEQQLAWSTSDSSAVPALRDFKAALEERSRRA